MKILGLIGQNGAGKTTTFRLILDFLTKDSGSVLWNGHTLSGKDYNTIGLIINNINVFEMDFKYEFSKKDIYYIENVIFELVQDFYDFDLSKVDIIVCE